MSRITEVVGALQHTLNLYDKTRTLDKKIININKVKEWTKRLSGLSPLQVKNKNGACGRERSW